MLFVRGATERNTERAKAPEKCARVVLESWRKWAWRDERKGRKKKTHQIRLLTAGIIHFCPRRLRLSAWLGGKKPSSAAVHLAHTGTPTSAWLKQTPLCAESWSWMGWEGVAAAAQSFSGLLWWQRGGGATAAFPTLQEHSFSEQRPPSSNPENNPPPHLPSPTSCSDLLAPPFLLPPSHAHTHKHI